MGDCIVLYHISYNPKLICDELCNAFEALGDVSYICDGSLLIDSPLTAYGIRCRIPPQFLTENMSIVIVQMYKKHCAGKLRPKQKAFVQKHILADPVIKVPIQPYAFYDRPL